MDHAVSPGKIQTHLISVFYVTHSDGALLAMCHIEDANEVTSLSARIIDPLWAGPSREGLRHSFSGGTRIGE